MPAPLDRATLPVDAQTALHLLYQMLRIRRFEERCAELYSAGKIRGFLHLCIGEEATAVGAISPLAPDEAVVSTYREHGHALARGIPMGAVMAEMFGKANGCCRGRGGSMHIFDAARRFYGGNAIVGGGLPLAVGLALADKMQGHARATLCIFGDGAVAEGEFHESMNLAALWKLPVLFLCENNLYAMGTALKRHQAQPDIHLKAVAYNVPSEAVDGMNVLEVARETRLALDTVRGGSGPFLLEARTYRFRAHSMYDPELYRTRQEVEAWKQRDPLVILAAALRAQGHLTAQDEQELERRALEEVESAVAFAESGSWEPLEDLAKDLHTPAVPDGTAPGAKADAPGADGPGVKPSSAEDAP